MSVNAANITDDMCRSVVELMPSLAGENGLLDGALGVCEPHRNHSRHELARLWTALACKACTLRYVDAANHPSGCIFVGMGHGWQPCQECGGSGLSPLGQKLRTQRASKET